MGFTKSDFFKSKFLRAADVASGPRTLTIKSVADDLIGEEKTPRACVAFRECEQRLVLNVTNWSVIEEAYGPDTDEWQGHKIKLMRAMVDFQGKRVPAIRVAAIAGKAAPDPEYDDAAGDGDDGADCEEAS